MLTIRFDRLHLRPDSLVLDVGAGFGRHAFEVARRGARVVALDFAADEVTATDDTFEAMVAAGEIAADRTAGVVRGDATRLPFDDESFDVVITSEVLEHVQDDVSALAEMARVLKPGGRLSATVPSWFPEIVNWRLSYDYHAPAVPGGHVRIYRRSALLQRLREAGLRYRGRHHAHALHSPYWWLKCAVGVRRDDHRLVRAYHAVLVWEMTHPRSPLHLAERLLNPLLGKSLVVYLDKPC